jgi:hypothetical protein
LGQTQEYESLNVIWICTEDMGSKKWLLYPKPIQIKPNENINARAIRIGFRASNISTN